MAQSYTVTLGNHQVGKVQVIKVGLYYRFVCRCKLTGAVMCRLYVVCGDKRESLGLVAPVEDGFGLDTRIPVKRIGEGDMVFYLMPKQADSGRFFPIYPEEPFSYIEKLKDGFLSIQNGQAGLLITN